MFHAQRNRTRWPFIYAFLLVVGFWTVCHASSSPVLTHEDPATQREFQNSYQAINTKPSIFISAGAPTFQPSKIGDLDISTTTSKVYISTSVASGGWIVLN